MERYDSGREMRKLSSLLRKKMLIYRFGSVCETFGKLGKFAWDKVVVGIYGCTGRLNILKGQSGRLGRN